MKFFGLVAAALPPAPAKQSPLPPYHPLCLPLLPDQNSSSSLQQLHIPSKTSVAAPVPFPVMDDASSPLDLSELQWQELQRDGFLVVRSVLPPSEVRALNARLDDLMCGAVQVNRSARTCWRRRL